MQLNALKCPKCGIDLLPPEKNDKIVKTNSYNDCLRKCNKCLIGFSNSKTKPKLIYENYNDNIPEKLIDGLDDTLKGSLNIINRKNKRNKIGFSTSEDALTWSFFKYFVLKNRINDLLNILNIERNDDQLPDIYLWGVCINNKNNNLENEIIRVSDDFKEVKDRRSEPDVIIKTNDKIVLIEVKYLSSNNINFNKEKYQKYLIENIDNDKLYESGHYELYRNWAFASKLSMSSSKFELINLGLNKLFNDKNKYRLMLFQESIKSSGGSFKKISWEKICNQLEKSKSYDDWFIDYLKHKIYRV